MSACHTPALESSVLVLNKLFMAVHVISVRRAFCLLCKELAEVVAVEDGQYATYDFVTWRELSEYRAANFRKTEDDWVRTVTSEIQVPRVIRLLGYDKLPKQAVKFNRRNIFARDNNQCQYCGKKYATAELSLDHVVPRSRGGTSTWENVVCSCHRCNRLKGGRTPVEAGMRLIRHPRRPQWTPFMAEAFNLRRYKEWMPFLSAVDAAYWNTELVEE